MLSIGTFAGEFASLDQVAERLAFRAALFLRRRLERLLNLVGLFDMGAAESRSERLAVVVAVLLVVSVVASVAADGLGEFSQFGLIRLSERPVVLGPAESGRGEGQRKEHGAEERPGWPLRQHGRRCFELLSPLTEMAGPLGALGRPRRTTGRTNKSGGHRPPIA
jgi:hypothetical protein